MKLFSDDAPLASGGSISPNDTHGFLDSAEDFARFTMAYKFGIDEVMTKVNILKEEFSYVHDYSPIDHVRSRLKSADSIRRKALRKGCDFTAEAVRARISDIAGIRITCSFISDTYVIRDMLARQDDITVVDVKDYIREPKSNGYQSLHMLIDVPVFMSDHVQNVRVEVQIRTVAMDFWASVEHKVYYKYDGEVPQRLLDELTEAATAVGRLDLKMESLYSEVAALALPSAENDERIA